MAKFEEVKHSGKKKEFNTGALREIQEGKGRFDLIPPRAMRRLAKHFENGAKVYGDRNWERGMPLSQFMTSCSSHYYKILEGANDEDHLAALAWNALCAIEMLELIEEGKRPEELNDLPKWE